MDKHTGVFIPYIVFHKWCIYPINIQNSYTTTTYLPQITHNNRHFLYEELRIISPRLTAALGNTEDCATHHSSKPPSQQNTPLFF